MAHGVSWNDCNAQYFVKSYGFVCVCVIHMYVYIQMMDSRTRGLVDSCV